MFNQILLFIVANKHNFMKFTNKQLIGSFFISYSDGTQAIKKGLYGPFLIFYWLRFILHQRLSCLSEYGPVYQFPAP